MAVCAKKLTALNSIVNVLPQADFAQRVVRVSSAATLNKKIR
jgi:hypothetical protein